MPLNYLKFIKISHAISNNLYFNTFVETKLLIIKKIEIYIYA